LVSCTKKNLATLVKRAANLTIANLKIASGVATKRVFFQNKNCFDQPPFFESPFPSYKFVNIGFISF
jgi:hypothetical protein